MKLFGLAGWKNSGKTHLMVRLLPVLTASGLSVSTIKHAHHSFDIDQPGKDSHAHREAGAREVLVASAARWALIHEHRDTPEPTLDELVARLAPVDLVLVEGFKSGSHHKLELVRAGNAKPMMWPDDPHIVALAHEGPAPKTHLPTLPLADTEAIAAFIAGHCGLALAQRGAA